MLLSLITIGSTIAFNIILSMTISGLYLSYFACCTLLLWRRCTSAIGRSSTYPSTITVNVPGAVLVWGPWRIRGALGIVVNAAACVYLLVVIFFSFWPPSMTIELAEMNYSVIMVGAVMLFAVLWYFLHAKKRYKGPVLECGEV